MIHTAKLHTYLPAHGFSSLPIIVRFWPFYFVTYLKVIYSQSCAIIPGVISPLSKCASTVNYWRLFQPCVDIMDIYYILTTWQKSRLQTINIIWPKEHFFLAEEHFLFAYTTNIYLLYYSTFLFYNSTFLHATLPPMYCVSEAVCLVVGGWCGRTTHYSLLPPPPRRSAQWAQFVAARPPVDTSSDFHTFSMNFEWYGYGFCCQTQTQNKTLCWPLSWRDGEKYLQLCAMFFLSVLSNTLTMQVLFWVHNPWLWLCWE